MEQIQKAIMNILKNYHRALICEKGLKIINAKKDYFYEHIVEKNDY